MEIIGYKVCNGPRHDLLNSVREKSLESVFKVVKDFDASQDNPWPLLYKELDNKYPNSKFILTVRYEEKWIKSLVNYSGYKSTDMRKWIYGIGYPLGNEELYINVYNKHIADVKEYFRNRPNDLLVIDLTVGEGWEKICSFPGKQIPNKDFPHTNKGTYHE